MDLVDINLFGIGLAIKLFTYLFFLKKNLLVILTYLFRISSFGQRIIYGTRANYFFFRLYKFQWLPLNNLWSKSNTYFGMGSPMALIITGKPLKIYLQVILYKMKPPLVLYLLFCIELRPTNALLFLQKEPKRNKVLQGNFIT